MGILERMIISKLSEGRLKDVSVSPEAPIGVLERILSA